MLKDSSFFLNHATECDEMFEWLLENTLKYVWKVLQL